MSQGKSFALDALKLILVGLLYFGVADLGLRLASINPSASPIWPATGLAVAAILLWGYRISPGIFIAAFAVNYLSAGSPFTSLGIALGNFLEALATAYLVKVYADGTRVFDSPGGVGKFALISALTTIISATIGVGSLVLTGQTQSSDAPPVWLTWWLGDYAGAIVVTPLVLLWLRPVAKPLAFIEKMPEVLIYVLAILVGIAAFSPLIPQTPLRDPVGFLAVAPLLWAGLRCGPRCTATVAAILAAFAVWGTAMAGGPFGRATLNESFLLLLMFIVSMAIPSLALSTDVAARRKSQEQQEQLLRELSHRVGNTLTILNSVFRRSARHAKSVSELEHAFQGRLMNLAATNRLLGEANWQSASLRELIKGAIEPYCPAGDESCEFSGEDIVLPDSVVTSLTMVLHELATNAARHGALTTPDGKLKIAWHTQATSGKNRQLHVSWIESGIPQTRTDVSTHKPGYGTALIDATVASLRGVVHRTSGDGSFSIQIVLPLANDLQAAGSRA